MKQSITKSSKSVSRKLTEQDIEGVARLIAEKRFTMTEAAQVMEIKPRQLENWIWKGSNKQKFDELISRLKAARINNLIDSVSVAVDGDPDRKIRADWRAAVWLAGLIDPSRYAAKPELVQNQLVLGNDKILADIVSKVYSPEPAKLDTKTPAALPEPGQTSQDKAESVQVIDNQA